MFLGRVFVILALFSLSGLDRAFVQAYAWGSMIKDRAPVSGLSDALDSTFSGNQPCELCIAIADSAHDENENSPINNSSEPQPKLFSAHLSLRTIAVFPPTASAPLPGFCGPADRSIVLELPTPPPRWV